MINDEKIKLQKTKNLISIIKFLILFILISYFKFNERFVRFFKFERFVPKFSAPSSPILLSLFIFR
jgi:hypothetical protein